MKRLVFSIFGLSLLCVADSALAIVVDGTRDAAYGSPLAVQTVQTQFGDANPPGALNGSELDAAYAKVESGRLYIMLTGNHEPNFNKLEIFIDSKPGGENALSGVPDYDYEPGDGNWISSNLFGFTFDTGFEADYHLFSRWSDNGNAPYEVDFVDRQGGVNAMVPGSAAVSPPPSGLIAMGTISAGTLGPNASGSALTNDLDFAINDNNTGGVLGGIDAADQVAAAAVATGMEFSIALADIGNPAVGETIKIAAMINNSNHNYLSNQFLGGLPAPQGNLANDGFGTLYGFFMDDYAGDQFFSITVPAPSLPGDINGDGWVDGLDYLDWAANFGAHPGPDGDVSDGDLNDDGWVDGLDYLEWAANFGSHVASAVPEPGTFALAGLAMLGLLSMRRRS